jgi:hypothetical protein
MVAESNGGKTTSGPLERVRSSFEKQGLMQLLGAEVVQTVSLSPVKGEGT